ncbi:MAG TPA: fibronectin type III domain-containing protein [Planctomycetota bacterium]|nr:fibronectin type III domain-containing protein [Planctomycetota bacterium]
MFNIRASATIFVALLTVVISAVLKGADPEAPRSYVNTTPVAPTGRTIVVNAGGSLQAAIDSAVYGDVIELQAGATFTGNFALRAKSGTGWITIRTSTPDGTFPAPGTRVQPASHAALMPKIVTSRDVAAIYTEGACHHYRLIGLEITMSNNTSYGLVTLGSGTETSVSALPHTIIIDRCYIHGNASGNVQNGIRLNSANTAIIDSHIDECHSLVSESHCIAGVNGPGPFKIVNNYLGGSTINVLFGGAVPAISGNVPSDIEFKRNLCTRPTNWRPSSAGYIGINWGVKNLFEIKNGQRVWMEGNIFEHNWPHEGTLPDGAPQHGWAILFTVRDEGGAVPWAVDQDITFINNIIRKSNCGLSYYGVEGQGTRRIKIENNLFDDIGLNWGNNDRSGMFLGTSKCSDITFNHNTIINDGDIAFCTGTAPNTGLVFKNNIVNHNAARTINMNYGFNGAGTGVGFSTLNFFFPSSYTYSRNAMKAPSPWTNNYPADNYYPASWSAVGFVDLANRNYRLASTSPYKGLGTDGKDLGCDIDAINAAINGTVTPPPDTTPPTISAVASSSITSSGATITWTTNEASTTQVEYGTTTAYGSSTTLVTTLVTSHSQGLSGLSPSTTYNYRVKSRDAAGNTATSGNFTFTTAAAPDTTPPTISSVAASSITSSGATITWTTNEASTTQVEYGTTTAYGSSTTLVTTLVTSHSQALSGLSASTTYNYRVKSRDAAGNTATSGNFTFTTAAAPDTTPPTISSVAASSITSSGATITWTTNEASTTQVEYGTTTAYGSSTTLVTTLVTSHSQGLSGLSPSTTYNYRVKSRDAAGNTATSSNFTFTTAAAPDTTPPTISAVAASSITTSSATITWTTNEASTTQVEYGTTTAYGSSTTLVTTLVTSHSQGLSGLSPSTTYNYRVKSRDAAGNTATSGNFTFTTAAAPDTTPPTISSVAASSITSSGATITWTTNEASTTQVEYGTATAYGSSTTLVTTLVTSHSQGLSGLSAGTTYNYRVKSRDAAGNTATSGNFTFTTAAAPPPPPPPPPPLAISSAPTATPNPAKTGQAVQFSVATSGGTAPISITWNFGDGSSGSGAAPTHVYSTHGTYTVQVTASDAAGQSASATLSLTVQRAKVRKNANISAALGSLSYTTTSRDTIAAAGTLDEPFDPAGATVSVDVNGAVATFTLDARGRGKSGTSTFTYSKKTGIFKVVLKNQSVASIWAAAGIIDMQAASGTMGLNVVLTINGEEYEGPVDVNLVARPGKSGKFRK